MLSPRFANDGKRLEQLNGVQLAALHRHLAKLQQGPYRQEAAPCPVCAAADDLLLAAKDRYGIPLRVVICRTCGLIRTDPRLTEPHLADFYATEYRPLYGGQAVPETAFFETQTAHGDLIVRRLQSSGCRIGPQSLVVEVGCGAGGILQAFRRRGAEVVGCDLGDDYLQFGRTQHGLDLRHGTLADLRLSRPADVIVYSHVLEHVLDLNGELARTKQALAPAGRVYIEVPSVKYIHHTYRGDFLGLLQNAHTFHFTARTLLNVMGRHGFAAITMTEEVAAVFGQGKIQPIISDFAPALEFLRRAEYLRHAYFCRWSYLRPQSARLLDALGLKRPVKKLLGFGRVRHRSHPS
jgi:2-polyprenyl-3-methyl-5-hydroxy-6-metoxy-1,4-benzoquinol methylase